MKLFIATCVDFFDFTFGRLLFATPFAGEVIGIAIGYAMFGPKAFFYGLEALDPTEQFDAFIPTCTLIALADRREQREAEQVAQLMKHNE